MMLRLKLTRVGCAVIAVVCCAAPTLAGTILQDLSTTNVYTTYTYPFGLNPGVLELNDTGSGLVATLAGGVPLPVGSLVDITLSLPLLAESGNPADMFAQGQFGAGVLSMVDSGNPGTTLFQANVTGFDLVESIFVPGSFAGAGDFTNAVYGGELSSVTLPTNGQILTSLLTWFSDPGLTSAIDINNFLKPNGPGLNPIYGQMNQLNVVPEPTAMVLLAGLTLAWRRRRRTR